MYDGSAQVNMETTQNRLSMAACNRLQRLGLGCAALGAGASRVRPHPSWPAWPPPYQVGWWLGLGSSCGGAWPRLSREVGLLHFSLCVFLKICFLLCAFFFILCIFHLFPGIDLQNILSQNTSGTWSIVNAYVSKFVYFSHFGHKLAVLNTTTAL
jgi:hypothetical protein